MIIFADESGLSERPSIRSTWAPRGKTPVVVHNFRWYKCSMMGGLIYRPDGASAKLTFEIIEGSYNKESIFSWCQRLVRTLAGTRAHLIWDRLKAHYNKAVRTFLKKHGITVHFLPGYSPNLNPTEWLWANLKGKELANLSAKDIAAASDEAKRGIRRIRSKQSLMKSFLKGAGLSFC